MCGILFFNTNNTDASSVTLFDKIKHRGPDYSSTTTHNQYFFGHHRLSIINPTDEQSNQPFETDNDILIANAEIYNWKSIVPNGNNDCKAISKLCRDFMKTNSFEHTIGQLNGDFAFVFFDKKTETIIIGRDCIGLKPLFVGYRDGIIVGISSELKSLNIDGITIRQIKPGSVHVISKQGTKKYSFVNVNTVEEIVIRNLIENSVRRRILHSDVPVALLCSGGIDSSIITCVASHMFPQRKFKAYCIHYTGAGESYDTWFAQIVCSRLPNVELEIFDFSWKDAENVIQEVIDVFETDDIQVIRAGIPMYLLAKHIVRTSEYKVLLSGEGADELFMGYSYFSSRNPTPQQAYQESNRLLKNLHQFDILRAERAFSSNGLELRVPFLDQDVMNYVKTLSGESRLPFNSVEKHLLRQSFQSLGLDEKVRLRQKERLSDGVGGGWVPDLIRYFNYKEQEEYTKMYNERYPKITVKRTERTLPKWCSTTTNNSGNLLMS